MCGGSNAVRFFKVHFHGSTRQLDYLVDQEPTNDAAGETILD